MGAARILPPVIAPDSPVADAASRQRELDLLRARLESLRNPAGAVRLAVQLLAGPLRSALREARPEDAARVADVLGALETATAELTRLLCPPVHGGGVTERAASVIAMPHVAGVEGLLAGVKQTVAQGLRLPATVEVTAEPGLQPAVDPADLQTALVGLVENAIESMARRHPGAAPWPVQLRVSVQPAEDLGEEMFVVFEVRDRGDGVPKGVTAWLEGDDTLGPGREGAGPGMSLRLARRVAEDAGGRLEVTRVAGGTRVRLCVPPR